METKIEEKTRSCFQFQPVLIPVQTKIATGNGMTNSVQMQFVQCIKENCMAWDDLQKSCKLLKR